MLSGKELERGVKPVCDGIDDEEGGGGGLMERLDEGGGVAVDWLELAMVVLARSAVAST